MGKSTAVRPPTTTSWPLGIDGLAARTDKRGVWWSILLAQQLQSMSLLTKGSASQVQSINHVDQATQPHLVR
jgi:hypothetical protein